jgi:hypothetical protein
VTPEERNRVREIYNDALSEHNRQIERLANKPERMKELGMPLTEEGLKYVSQLQQHYVEHAKVLENWIEDLS